MRVKTGLRFKANPKYKPVNTIDFENYHPFNDDMNATIDELLEIIKKKGVKK